VQAFASAVLLAWAAGSAWGADAEVSQAPALRGADLRLTIWETSGVTTAPEAYENQLWFIFEPRFDIGRQFLRGRWAEPLAVTGRMLLSTELAGSDPQYRGSQFASPALLRDAPGDGEALRQLEAEPEIVHHRPARDRHRRAHDRAGGGALAGGGERSPCRGRAQVQVLDVMRTLTTYYGDYRSTP
jgi:hypothetical protein